MTVDETLGVLLNFFGLAGNEPSDSTMQQMAVYLAPQCSKEDLTEALRRCLREVQYPIRTQHIIQRLPTSVKPVAESLAAWTATREFCSKYCGSNPYGAVGPEHGSYPESRWRHAWMQLPGGAREAVRAIGGWAQILRATEESLPFLQQRFQQAYECADQIAVARTNFELPAHIVDAKRLAAAPQADRRAVLQKQVEQVVEQRKPDPVATTDFEARRAELKRQAEAVKAKAARAHA